MIKKQYIALVILVSVVAIVAIRSWSRTQPSLYVINVLDKQEYDDCHIKGSINIPFEDMSNFAKSLNKQTELIIYCSNYWCTASHEVAKDLLEIGFTKVWVYEAGMAEWFQQNLPVVGACKQSYLTKIVAKPHQQDIIPVISTLQLKEKLEKAGLLK